MRRDILSSERSLSAQNLGKMGKLRHSAAYTVKVDEPRTIIVHLCAPRGCALGITVEKDPDKFVTGLYYADAKISWLSESRLPGPQFVMRPLDAEGWFALHYELGARVVTFGIAVDDLGFPSLPHF